MEGKLDYLCFVETTQVCDLSLGQCGLDICCANPRVVFILI